MHFYAFNIGDYHAHTGHLEPLEDLAYRRMLDWCYLHERPLPDDIEQIAKLIRMRSHCDCIAFVLRSYFVRNASTNTWWQARIEREINKAGEKSAKAALSAKSRWHKTKDDANALRTHSERNATQDTIHNTQDTNIDSGVVVVVEKPSKRKKASNKETPVDRPDYIHQQLWDDWLVIRKKKNSPLTQTAWALFCNEAVKAGWPTEDAIKECCLRNWASFKSKWVIEKASAIDERRNQMSELTRGLSVHKPKGFWSNAEIIEAQNVEAKRLL